MYYNMLFTTVQIMYYHIEKIHFFLRKTPFNPLTTIITHDIPINPNFGYLVEIFQKTSTPAYLAPPVYLVVESNV